MARPGTWLMVDVRGGILHILALSSRKEHNNHQETVQINLLNSKREKGLGFYETGLGKMK